MKSKKVISYLIIANLIVIFLYILGKLKVVNDFLDVFLFVIFTPIVFGVFLFYILKPLNELFIDKGLKSGMAATLTLVIFIFILSGVIKYFGDYFMKQIVQLREIITSMIRENNIRDFAYKSMAKEEFKFFIEGFSNRILNSINMIFYNAKGIFNKGMMIFSNFILIILITFFLLKDGMNFRKLVMKLCPEKYKDVVSDILFEGDNVLSTYIIGQGIVALSLAIMVFIGYKVINIPGALFLSTSTFILAFIPFVGFFISMIIPYIIAISMGFNMILKLTLLFVIAQTLKGRVVVPFIMGRTMKIHPVTDIFLVVGSAAIGGPIAAFCIIPIYSLLKVIIKNFKKRGYISYEKFIEKRFKV
ncbi:AI-2E family transporter [Eubacterium multiforme]|uniref:PurR-regulated permease PerM n=1 Tax=Eubacterium multiforme TaxID=83339 RepID=A0ABT9UXF4_9FIRM|nr:AI-2E family transporter [Eubacterium multiforme]MDQ0150997.1 putative PurR-regulated permease PerM [Eubacterium multiforme]